MEIALPETFLLFRAWESSLVPSMVLSSLGLVDDRCATTVNLIRPSSMLNVGAGPMDILLSMDFVHECILFRQTAPASQVSTEQGSSQLQQLVYSRPQRHFFSSSYKIICISRQVGPHDSAGSCKLAQPRVADRRIKHCFKPGTTKDLGASCSAKRRRLMKCLVCRQHRRVMMDGTPGQSSLFSLGRRVPGMDICPKGVGSECVMTS